MVLNTVRFGMNPQQALDAPRGPWLQGRVVEVEHALGARGHDVRVQLEAGSFGRGQIIRRDPQTGTSRSGKWFVVRGQ